MPKTQKQPLVALMVLAGNEASLPQTGLHPDRLEMAARLLERKNEFRL